MGERKKRLGQAYEGWLGNGLAIFSVLSLFTMMGRELATVLGIWKTPPVSAFGVVYLLLLLVPLYFSASYFSCSSR